MEPKIDIMTIIPHLEDYVIIRKSNRFPDYELFDDLDIVCKDSEKNASIVKRHGSSYFDNGFNFKQTYEKNHLHLDFHYHANKINFRFDFIDTINHFPTVDVKSAFMDKVLERKQKLHIKEIPYFVPAEDHEMMFRLLEYFDYPSKYRHLKYVRERIKNNPQFFDLLREYTNLDILRTQNLLMV